VDGDFREVAEDDAAVVGGHEFRVRCRSRVGLGDHFQAEALGGLGAVLGFARGDVGDDAVFHLEDGV
jgi:hypothetical protein